MSSTRWTRGPGLERAVLAFAALCAGILALASRGAPADPDRAGRAALEGIARGVVRGLRATWRSQLLEEDPGPASAARFRWERMPGEPPVAVEAKSGGAAALAFDLYLMQAVRSEVEEGDLAAARGWIDEALRLEGVGAARRGLGWLRGIQLARKEGDPEGAVKLFQAAREGLTGDEAWAGTAIRLLASLAVAPALEDQERRELQQELASWWAADRLALPGEGARLVRGAGGVRVREAPRVVALLDAVAELGEGGERLLAEARDRRAVRALERELGALPEPAAGGPWEVRSTPLGLLAARRRGELREALVAEPAAWAVELARSAREAGLLPEGFELDATGESPHPVVAKGLSLSGSALVVSLVHPDPDRLVAGERGRARWTRIVLVVTAFFVAIAGLVAFRSLARERRLQELRSAFVASVSHELRTQLSSILLMAENLEEGRVPDAAAERRYHRTIRSEALRLRRLIDDVLDFSRLERGERPKLAPEAIDLAGWAEELERGLARTRPGGGGEVRVFREELPENACLDGPALRRVLENLVDNALKHGGSPKHGGGGDVELRLRGDGGSLVCEVRDFGPGIPSQDRERVFAPALRPGRRGAARGGPAGLSRRAQVLLEEPGEDPALPRGGGEVPRAPHGEHRAGQRDPRPARSARGPRPLDPGGSRARARHARGGRRAAAADPPSTFRGGGGARRRPRGGRSVERGDGPEGGGRVATPTSPPPSPAAPRGTPPGG